MIRSVQVPTTHALAFCRNPPHISLRQEGFSHLVRAFPLSVMVPVQVTAFQLFCTSTILHIRLSTLNGAHPTEHLQMSNSNCAPLLAQIHLSPSSSLFPGLAKPQKLVMFKGMICC